MEYIKDYDKWNILKQHLEKKEGIYRGFKEADVWWVSLGVNIGDEQDGKSSHFSRPVLILRKYNNSFFRHSFN